MIKVQNYHCAAEKPELWEEFKARFRKQYGMFPVGIWTEKETYYALAQLKNGTAPFM